MKNFALISCYDKSGLEKLVPQLLEKGFELLATGGTYEHLSKMGHKVMELSKLTGKGEVFGGRVKSLQYEVLGSILFRPHKDESEWPHPYRIGAVVCNFYPFQEKASLCKSTEELIEWIDIGGPTMVRSAAKNFHHVYCFTHPRQYEWLKSSTDDKHLKEQLALEAFDLIMDLDQKIAFELHQRLRKELRYGENPHQKAVFISQKNHQSFGDISFNNIRDAEAALKFILPFESATACVVKHGTLCGAAVSAQNDINAAFIEAWEGDTVSRFGGIIGLNQMPTAEIEETLNKKFIEVLVMPLTEKSQKWAQDFHTKKPKTKIFLYEKSQMTNIVPEVFANSLGTLIQEKDSSRFEGQQDKAENLEDFFALWTAACSKSNAITLTGRNLEKGLYFLAGAGQGQPNRIESLEKLAIPRAQDFCFRRGYGMAGLLCSSDAFFPFDDILHVLSSVSIKKVIQPGGSKNDALVKETAQKLGIEMQFTEERHFWH